MRVSCRHMAYTATAIAALATFAPAAAQEVQDIPAEADSDSGSSDAIVVTAQRREQLIQDVPISITAFSAETIEKANITEAKEYLALAPNVSFTEDGETGNRSINIAIRGVSNIGLGEVSTQQSIGYYLDEQSVGSTANGTYNPQLIDIERIEVLRGPQGTYFGRNASGGALNITTKKPDDNFYAEAGAEVARFDTYKAYGVVNLPLSETLFFRGVASYETSDGLIRNVNPNGAANSGYDYVHARGALRYVPTDRLTLDLSVAYTDEDEGLDATVPSGVLDLDTQSIFGAGFEPIDDQLGFYPENQRRVNHNAPEFNRNNFLLVNNRINWEGDGFSIRSITGYIDSGNERLFDQDNISADAINRRNDYDGRSFSQELRVQSEDAEVFDWVVGGLYAHDRIRQFNSITAGTDTTYTDPVTGEVIGLLPPIPPGFRINENNKIFKTESWAAFADLTWHVSPRFELIVGGRYSHDTISNRNFGVVAFESPVPDTSARRSFDDFSPRFVVRYEFSDDASVYASASKGYKAGGVDINTDIVSPFSPETLWNYEVGLKGSALDNALQYSASIFYLKWKDLQVQTNFLRDPTDISSAVELTLNAAKASNKGFEVEMLARVSPELRLSGAFGYLDSEFDSFPEAVLAGGNAVDLSGFRLPKTPRYTFSTAIDYERELTPGWDIYSRTELSYRSSAPGDLEGVAAAPLGLPRFPYVPGGYTVVNLRAGLQGDRYELGVYVENLFKEDYYTGTQDNFGLGGIRLRPHPRVWGLTGKVKFGS